MPVLHYAGRCCVARIARRAATSDPNRTIAPKPIRPPRPALTSLLWALLGAGLVLLGGAAFLASYSYDAEAQAVVLRGNFPVTAGAGDPADLSTHNSPTLVRNPRDARELAIASRIDLPRFSCALHVSADGGSSWARTPIPIPAGEEPKCYAPDVAFGADGTLYLSFVTLAGRGNVPHAVWFSTSTDGGRHLTKPVRVLGPLSFQVRLAADPRASGRVYLTWLDGDNVGLLRFDSPGNPIRAMRSDDGGKTWTEPASLSDPSRSRVVAPAPAVGPSGELYVLYLDLGEDRFDYHGLHRGRGGPPSRGPWKLVLARSLDRGTSWEESIVARRLVPTERFIVFIPPFPSIAVDKGSGRVYAAFQDRRLGDADVFVWSLSPGDARWDGPTRVNDTSQRDGTSQYRPALSVAPDGRLDVVYYDRRGDPKDRRNDVSLQSSFDGGASFAPRVRLSTRRFDARLGFGAERGLPDLGSRLASLSTTDRLLAVWTDTRAGSQLTQKQDLYRALAAFSRPPRLEEPLASVLRYGGLAVALLGLAFGAIVATSRYRRLRRGIAA
jgi:hypothetical protein